jgi:hypothetical protein
VFQWLTFVNTALTFVPEKAGIVLASSVTINIPRLIICVTFWFLTASTMKVAVFQYVATCDLTMEAVGLSKRQSVSARIHETTFQK